MAEPERPEFEKRVVRLPDGRTLVYYDFPRTAPAQAPAAPPPAAGRGTGEER